MSLTNRILFSSKHLKLRYPLVVQSRCLMKKEQRYDIENRNESWAKEILESPNISKDEPPHQIHVVTRIKSMYGRPYWEKDIIKELGLFDIKQNQPTVHKNSEYINKLLKEVKHLVSIQPLRLPHGLPVHESDFLYTKLTSTGELLIQKRLADPITNLLTYPQQDEVKESKWKLKGGTIKTKMLKQLQTFKMNEENFKAKSIYKYNEDGKESRYSDLPKNNEN